MGKFNSVMDFVKVLEVCPPTTASELHKHNFFNDDEFET